jgi:ABC-type nitrate/sulfonate/bicarbonate transport system substrate-binding protein
LQGAGAVTFFQSKVLDGGAMWNEDLREYADRKQMIADLSRDPFGIAYAPLGYGGAGVKAIALADGSAGPFTLPTRASVADRSYPLSRPVYFAYTIDNEKTEIADPRVDPKVREFLRYILSKQGQQDVAREGVYLPLPAAVAAEQLKKLESREIPPEMKMLASDAAAADKVRISADEDPIVMRLAESLGHFRQEGLEVEVVDLEKIVPHDYLIQQPLVQGRIDAAYHWFNHTIFGARQGFPVQAIMMFNDAPGMTVMVANRVKGEIRGAADFKGRRVAEGAGYGTKSVITGYLARKAGLPAHSYTPVMLGKAGRQEAVIGGLEEGAVDVMTFQEPVTSALLETKMVTALYDLNSGNATAKVLGAPFPAQSLLVSPDFIARRPGTAQRLVNAFVRTMRFVNSHDAEEIAARLPADYFKGKDRAAEVKLIRDTLPTFARGDYSFSPRAVHLVVDAVRASDFDASEEGRWRAGGDHSKVAANRLYTNRFVQKAMKEIQ